MTRQQIHDALNSMLNGQLEKYSNGRRHGAWLTGVHLELFAGCSKHTAALHR